MRITEKRFPIIAALLAAFFLCNIPVAAAAPATPFSSSNCMQNMQNAYTKTAQDRTANSSKIFAAGQLMSSKAAYCWSSIIMPIWQAMGTILAAGSSGIFNAIGTIIWTLMISILTSIINSIINAICAAALGFVAGLISYIKNLLCLPLPHFSLSFSLGGFKGGSCNGISLLGLATGLSGTRATAPAAWGVMGINRQLH